MNAVSSTAPGRARKTAAPMPWLQSLLAHPGLVVTGMSMRRRHISLQARWHQYAATERQIPPPCETTTQHRLRAQAILGHPVTLVLTAVWGGGAPGEAARPSPIGAGDIAAGWLPDILELLLRHPTREVERLTGVHRRQLAKAFKAFLARLDQVYKPAPQEILAIDDVHPRGHAYTVIGYPQKRGPLIEVLDASHGPALERWLEALPWRDQVRIFVIDPDLNLRAAIRQLCPNAVILGDVRHFIAWVHKVLAKIRNADGVPYRGGKKRGKRGDPLKAALEANPLGPGGRAGKPPSEEALRRWERHRRLREATFARHPRLGDAHAAYTRFYRILKSESRAEAVQAFEAFRDGLDRELAEYFKAIVDQLAPDGPTAGTRKSWSEEFFALFDHLGTDPDRRFHTTGFIEAVNRQIKVAVWRGRGRPEHGRVRARMLFAHHGIDRALVVDLAGRLTTTHPHGDRHANP